MTLARRTGAAVAASVLVLALSAPLVPAAAAPRTATVARSATAAVNLLPDAAGAGGFVGGASFTTSGGATTVDVYLSRSEPVTCSDGSEDVRSTTLTAASAAAATLQIDQRLRNGSGEALVDVAEEVSAGCGADPTTTVHPAQRVALAVVGTSVRFRTGIASRASSGPDAAGFRSVDLARDGTGTLTVGTWVTDAASDAAFLRSAVDRSWARGAPVELPPNAAPAGGFGALASFVRDTADGGREDVYVTATIGPAPARAASVFASAIRTTVVECGDGTAGERVEIVEGSGPASVAIDARLARADATASVPGYRVTFDGCTGEVTETDADVPVALALTASGPAVRSVDDRFQVTPGAGVERDRITYSARWAAGQVTVGDLSGAPDLAAISRGLGQPASAAAQRAGVFKVVFQGQSGMAFWDSCTDLESVELGAECAGGYVMVFDAATREQAGSDVHLRDKRSGTLKMWEYRCEVVEWEVEPGVTERSCAPLWERFGRATDVPVTTDPHLDAVRAAASVPVQIWSADADESTFGTLDVTAAFTGVGARTRVDERVHFTDRYVMTREGTRGWERACTVTATFGGAPVPGALTSCSLSDVRQAEVRVFHNLPA